MPNKYYAVFICVLATCTRNGIYAHCIFFFLHFSAHSSHSKAADKALQKPAPRPLARSSGRPRAIYGERELCAATVSRKGRYMYAYIYRYVYRYICLYVFKILTDTYP